MLCHILVVDRYTIAHAQHTFSFNVKALEELFMAKFTSIIN